MRKLCHLTNLHSLGGVQRSFASFVARSSEQDWPFEQHALIGGDPHPHLRQLIRDSHVPVHRYKYWGPFKVPPHPRALRLRRLNSLLRQLAPDVVVMWDYSKDIYTVERAQAINSKVIYYEHGGAWSLRGEHKKKAVLDRVDGIVCNSHAAKRVLQLQWQVSKPIAVCLNALRPELAPAEPTAKSLDLSRPLRLGVAGRMVPLKGFSLALRTVKTLADSGVLCELHVAGSGKEEGQLTTLAHELGIHDRIKFHGLVARMAEFYRHIDILLCPSITEAFGLVSIEAAAWGCPVVVAGVNGLPETLEEGVTGFSVRPTLPLSAYPEYRDDAGLARRIIYDPATDQLGPAQLADPEDIAMKVRAIVADDTFARMSEAAVAHIRTKFDFDRQIHDFFAAVEQLTAR